MTDIREMKAKLRAEFTAKRDELSAEEKNEYDKKIAAKFFNLISYRHAPQILLYASTGVEISTVEIFKRAIDDGKKCFYPLCGEESSMTFRRVTDLSELHADMYNILAPSADSEEYSPLPSDICIIPAMSYDKEGYRLGYGKGYYDRFLSTFEGVKVGFCIRNFVSDRLPRGRFDVKADILVTEKGVLSL